MSNTEKRRPSDIDRMLGVDPATLADQLADALRFADEAVARAERAEAERDEWKAKHVTLRADVLRFAEGSGMYGLMVPLARDAEREPK